MKSFRQIYLGVLLCLGLLIPLNANAKLKKWNQKMQELGSILSEMMPLVATSRSLSKTEIKQLEQYSGKLKELAHVINFGSNSKGSPLPPEADPTLGFVSSMLEKEIKRSHEVLKAGYVDYARANLKNVSGYCIACHTRNNFGPEFPTVQVSPGIEKLPPLQKAETLTALRQFDGALEVYESYVRDAKVVESRPFEWATAVRNSLILIVRIKNDPDHALKLLDQISALPKVPEYFSNYVVGWKKSIKLWKEESQKKFETEQHFYQEANRLMDQGRALQQYGLDHSGDIYFLRVTAIVHAMMSLYPNGKYLGQAFLLAGASYEVLEDRILSPLPQMYYEQCVRLAPGTVSAQDCYRRYEENTYFGYTGSAGTSIPEDVQQDMADLKKLAFKK